LPQPHVLSLYVMPRYAEPFGRCARQCVTAGRTFCDPPYFSRQPLFVLFTTLVSLSSFPSYKPHRSCLIYLDLVQASVRLLSVALFDSLSWRFAEKAVGDSYRVCVGQRYLSHFELQLTFSQISLASVCSPLAAPIYSRIQEAEKTGASCLQHPSVLWFCRKGVLSAKQVHLLACQGLSLQTAGLKRQRASGPECGTRVRIH
jgi:hypothetical protein